MKIRHKIGLSTLGLAAIIAGMFLATWFTTRQQADEGLVINLAGRQRMLTQKMTKEALRFRSDPSPEVARRIRNTVGVFDLTLSALTDSGRAPLGLDLDDTRFRDCPEAVGPVRRQLGRVRALWIPFRTRIEALLSGEGDGDAQVAWLLANNLPLLAEMNKAVGMMQAQSERRVRTLLVSQGVGWRRASSSSS